MKGKNVDDTVNEVTITCHPSTPHQVDRLKRYTLTLGTL